jgi:hypothetical protein
LLQVAWKLAMATRTLTPHGHVHFFIFDPFGLAGGTGRSGDGPGRLGVPAGGSAAPGDGGYAVPCRRQ